VDLVGRERSKVSGTPEARSDLGQHLHDIDDEAKTALTVALIKDGKRRGVMVFCRTRRRAGWVAAALRRHEVKTVLIHGDRSQRQRQEALAAFAAGKADVVVATDVASRGLHVPAARCVINYDVPLLPEEYVHRVGRAGHGGGTAEAFTLRCPSDMERWMHVERAMRVKLVPEKAPAFGAYMRTRDGFAPDSEGEFRPGMRAPMQGARAGAARQDSARQDSARKGPSRAGSARSGAAPHGGGRIDTRRAPTKSKRPAPRPGATRGLVDPTAAEAETTGRSLASMIMHAPSAARRNKKRIQKGTAKQKRTANQRGKQRKAPITKGQKPGGGVKRAS
jgi:ATP-dependent RNA helicase RhlE